MDYKRIGARIREARKAAGMTQEQLAEAVGISAPYLSELECATKFASLGVMLRIASALDVSPAQLFTDGQANADTLLALFDDCTEAERQILFDMVRALKRSLRQHRPAA